MFSIPKIIRIYFLFDRTLLKELARIAWEVLGLYYKNAVNKESVTAATAASIQTLGDFLGASTSSGLVNISLSRIVEDKNQPRKTFNNETIMELAGSIKEQGIINPITHNPHPLTKDQENEIDKIINSYLSK